MQPVALEFGGVLREQHAIGRQREIVDAIDRRQFGDEVGQAGRAAAVRRPSGAACVRRAPAASRASRVISSNVRRSADLQEPVRSWNVDCGMQYGQRKLHRSMTEMRRSWIGRPSRSRTAPTGRQRRSRSALSVSSCMASPPVERRDVPRRAVRAGPAAVRRSRRCPSSEMKSPEPRVGRGIATRPSVGLCSICTGRKNHSAGFTVKCRAERHVFGRARARAAASRSSAGTTYRSRQTSADTGLPGRPNTVCPAGPMPNQIGLPGRCATLWNTSRHAEFAQHARHVIEAPHRDAAGQHDHVVRREVRRRGGSSSTAGSSGRWSSATRWKPRRFSAPRNA